MAVSHDINLDKIKWVEWENRHGITRAHAVDPGSEQRTGKLRTLTGALIPDNAVPAKPATEKDKFSSEVIERLREVQSQKAARAEEQEAAKAAREAKAVEKAAAKAAKQAEAAAAREAAAAKKAAEKATKTAEKAAAPAAPSNAGGKLKKRGLEYVVIAPDGQEIGVVEGLDPKLGPFSLVITDKVWVINQQGKKVAQGAIKKPKK